MHLGSSKHNLWACHPRKCCERGPAVSGCLRCGAAQEQPPWTCPEPGTEIRPGAAGLQLPLQATPSTTYQYASAPEASAGVPIPVPLYYPPPNANTPQTYPGTVFSYIECFDGTPILNLTVSQLMVRPLCWLLCVHQTGSSCPPQAHCPGSCSGCTICRLCLDDTVWRGH